MVAKKSQKSNKAAKKGPNSNVEGDRFRQKNRIPEKIRKTVGDDRKCMTFFVSWGVNTVGEAAQPFTPAAQQTYHRRKVRDGELKTARAQGAGDEGTRMDKATGRNEPSTNGSSQPISSVYATAASPKPPMLPPPASVSHGTFHEWSLHSPSNPSIPAVATRRNSPPAPTYHTMHDPSSYPPQTSARAQRIVYGHVVDEVVELKYPYNPAPATDSTGPQSPSVARDALTDCSLPATPSLNTDCSSFSTASSSPPSPVWNDPPGFNSARSSALTATESTPALSDVQDSDKSKDVLSAVYQESFIHRSSDSHYSSPQPPAPVLGTWSDTHSPQLVDHAPQHYQAYPPKPAPIDNAYGAPTATCATECVEQGCQDIGRWSYAAHTAQSEDDERMVWSAPSVCSAQAEEGQSDYTVDDAYTNGSNVDVQSPPVVQWTSYAIHSSPPAMRTSSHSELAQALHFSPDGFAETGALSTTDSPSLYSHFSGIDTPDDVPLALAYPQDAAISVDEFARLIDECFYVNEHLLSEVSSLLAGMTLPAGQRSDVYY